MLSTRSRLISDAISALIEGIKAVVVQVSQLVSPIGSRAFSKVVI